MTNIISPQPYILKNELLGPSYALASTLQNASLTIESSNIEDDHQLWFANETSVPGYYRLHTVGKGEYFALDVLNYIGSQTLDLHFFANQELTGQYWRFDNVNDGSISISNNFTGPDIVLNIQDQGKPMLAAGGQSGSRWILSVPTSGSQPTTGTAASTASVATIKIDPSSSPTTTPSNSSTTTTTTPVPPTTNSASSSPNEPSTGALAGIVVGAVVGVAMLGALIYWLARRWRRRSRAPKQDDSSFDMQVPGGPSAGPQRLGAVHVLHGP
ncbi:hypothetical protein BDW02DRAFT_574519 [Decorospora gaudefroyi]|uniref:Ricin B lectin domain-containing protein n=1 Tax=Decorospora gaudefroyi TaxID=184978 RepID=A0A6A5K2Q0_9PLEO|nr:hypothetical protein BDW02DRAFT_574519 [Decorospora gaudefroyi]